MMFDRRACITAALAILASLGCEDAVITEDNAEVVFSASPQGWYEAAIDHGEPGLGLTLLYGGANTYIHAQRPNDGQPPTYNTGVPVTSPLPGDTAVREVLRGPNGLAVVLVGEEPGDEHWRAADLRVHRWIEGLSAPAHLASIPNDAVPAWSPDGGRVVFRSPSDPRSLTVIRQDGSRFDVSAPGPIVDYAWRVGTPELVVLVDQGDGSYSVLLGDADTGSTTTVVRAMDGVPRTVGAGLAVGADGTFAIVAAVQEGTPSERDRRRHSTDRDLDLFRIDLNSGAVRHIGGTDEDDHHPRLTAEGLYWTSTSIETDVVLVPATGGDPQIVVPGGQSPTWHPEGSRLGFVIGDFREADWTYNFDGAAIGIAENGDPSGSPEVLLEHAGADFAPTWSPDGAWLVYRRVQGRSGLRPESTTASEDGGSDDLFIRSLSHPPVFEEDQRLTDWGTDLGYPVWSPTSAQVVVTDRNVLNDAGTIVPSTTHRAWVLDLVPSTGQLRSATLLALPHGVEEIKTVAWAPDGRVAIEAQEADSVSAVWTMTPGRGAGRVTAFVSNTRGGLAWDTGSGNQDRIVLSARSEGTSSLFSIEATGRGTRRLSPPGRNLIQPAVSPDGSWIAATEIRIDKKVWRSPLP